MNYSTRTYLPWRVSQYGTLPVVHWLTDDIKKCISFRFESLILVCSEHIRVMTDDDIDVYSRLGR
jgi:hypothetical protein